MANSNYNPDVLNCIANLSNDEVFTPPELANRVLDLLPQDLFRSPDTRFLDPFTKSGVFLREIVKRLDRGLEAVIPDRQLRIDHILHNQVFGIAITELTAYLSRRSVYCSKHADGKYSVSRFDDQQGNIIYKVVQHTWRNGKCMFCGASKTTYDRGPEFEQYAYQFIHTERPDAFFNMTFDVICGNPPYQLSCASEKTMTNGSFASAIYPLFIDQACKLKPRYITMITPSRWMTKAGQGISDEWVDRMITGNHFVEIHDFHDASECFAGVEIKGGVNYFLYQPSYSGKCHYVLHTNGKEIVRDDYLDPIGAGIVIRDALALEIIDKIARVEGKYYINNSFSNLVSPKHFFDKDERLNTNWKGYSKKKDAEHTIKFYLNRSLDTSGIGWVKMTDIPKSHGTIGIHKIFIPEAGGTGTDSKVLGQPICAEPNSVCSYTYLCIGYDPVRHNYSKDECENIASYIRTRFFRYMVSIKKRTQHAPRETYQFVPVQDFSHSWTDEMLYKKYNLTKDEIAFIESMIQPMD